MVHWECDLWDEVVFLFKVVNAVDLLFEGQVSTNLFHAFTVGSEVFVGSWVNPSWKGLFNVNFMHDIPCCERMDVWFEW